MSNTGKPLKYDTLDALRARIGQIAPHLTNYGKREGLASSDKITSVRIWPEMLYTIQLRSTIFPIHAEHQPWLCQNRYQPEEPEGLLHDRSHLTIVAHHGQVYTSCQEARVESLQVATADRRILLIQITKHPAQHHTHTYTKG